MPLLTFADWWNLFEQLQTLGIPMLLALRQFIPANQLSVYHCSDFLSFFDINSIIFLCEIVLSGLIVVHINASTVFSIVKRLLVVDAKSFSSR